MSGFAAIPGVALAADERVLDDRQFSASNVLFFLHLRFATTNRRVVGRAPNTLLGVIPVGSTLVNYPLPNVAGIAIRTRVSTAAVLLGLLFVLAGIGAKGGNGVAIVIGLLFLFVSLRTEIAITNSGGQTIGHRVAIWDRSSASAFIQGVGTLLAAPAERRGMTSDSPGTAQPAERSDAVRDGLVRLNQLRDQGLITAAEFDAKRRELLGRL